MDFEHKYMNIRPSNYRRWLRHCMAELKIRLAQFFWGFFGVQSWATWATAHG